MKTQDKLAITKEKSPWYKDGLQFKCTGCGKCCTGAPGAVWLKPHEIDTIAAYLKITKEEFIKLQDEFIKSKTELGKYFAAYLEKEIEEDNLSKAKTKLFEKNENDEFVFKDEKYLEKL